MEECKPLFLLIIKTEIALTYIARLYKKKKSSMPFPHHSWTCSAPSGAITTRTCFLLEGILSHVFQVQIWSRLKRGRNQIRWTTWDGKDLAVLICGRPILSCLLLSYCQSHGVFSRFFQIIRKSIHDIISMTMSQYLSTLTIYSSAFISRNPALGPRSLSRLTQESADKI